MSLDLSTLTARELEIYAAGYTDAAADKRAELARADAHLAQAAADLARANSDADRYYRAAFNPAPSPHRAFRSMNWRSAGPRCTNCAGQRQPPR
jgi:hypothetical protein